MNAGESVGARRRVQSDEELNVLAGLCRFEECGRVGEIWRCQKQVVGFRREVGEGIDYVVLFGPLEKTFTVAPVFRWNGKDELSSCALEFRGGGTQFVGNVAHSW